jgi:tRNA(Ile)-lysidine synthase
METQELDENDLYGKVELGLRVKDFIKQHSLISPGGIVVVGVSGGGDSVCLLHVLARWRSEFDIRLHIAHLNHQLRGDDSDADAEYVTSLASKLGIPVTIGKHDVAAYRDSRNCSIEEAARELRYDFLARVATDVGADRVAVGHTRDDQVETILMHILRGAGTSGLCGLKPCSPIPSESHQRSATGYRILVIRPLLDVTREEAMSYCQEQQLEPRVDSSNLSLSFFRNRLRLELLPLLREYNPNVDEALLRLAKIAGDDVSFLEQQAFELWDEVARQEGDVIYLDNGKSSALPVALQRQLVRLAVGRLLADITDIEANHIEAIRSLLGKPVGKRISLPHGLVCRREYDAVVLGLSSPSPCPLPPFHGEFPVKVPGETILPGWRVTAGITQRSAINTQYVRKHPPFSTVAELDWHRAGTELFVRQCQMGDRFQPLGMSAPKKLKHFMIDAKIPLSWRENIPLVCSREQIIWVVGWRIDDRVKVTGATRKILRLEFIKSS